MYAFTAYVGGGNFWQQSMFQTLGVPKYEFIPDVVYETRFAEWWMVYGGIVLAFNTISRCVTSLDCILLSNAVS
jgi:ethanolaminephosphotransferase